MANPAETKTVALIAGPTASGKTALALELAKRHDAVIINADSAQVYSPLPLLSARPTNAEMAQCPHRLFAYMDGRTPCSAAAWAQDARREIEAAWAAARLPVLVGGTGLYLRILLQGVAPVPEIDPAIRADIRRQETREAYEQLLAADPAMAKRLHANDSSRIKRALEVILSTGRSIAEWREVREGGVADEIDLRPLILLPPREWIYERCDTRFVQMMERGAVEEVAALLKRNLPADAPVLRAIGVPEIAAMLAGQLSKAEAVAAAQLATRQYAKRQYTWFSNQSPPDWPRWHDEINSNNIDKMVTLFQL